MATDTVEGESEADADAEGWDDHLRGVTATTVASLLGIVAGLASQAFASGPKDQTGVTILALAVLVQLPIYKLAGMEVEEFGAKQYLYIAFMTFALWFVSWGILLTTGATL